MVKLEWKVNGRTVPSNRLADELGKSIRHAATDKVKHAIAGVRCPLPRRRRQQHRCRKFRQQDELHIQRVLRQSEAGDRGAPALGDHDHVEERHPRGATRR